MSSCNHVRVAFCLSFKIPSRLHDSQSSVEEIDSLLVFSSCTMGHSLRAVTPSKEIESVSPCNDRQRQHPLHLQYSCKT
eukprot:757269-Hanusia_phi.AAC.4